MEKVYVIQLNIIVFSSIPLTNYFYLSTPVSFFAKCGWTFLQLYFTFGHTNCKIECTIGQEIFLFEQNFL